MTVPLFRVPYYNQPIINEKACSNYSGRRTMWELSKVREASGFHWISKAKKALASVGLCASEEGSLRLMI